MSERGHIAIRQGILDRPRWPFFRRYLGRHLRSRVGAVVVWACDFAHGLGRATYHVGAALGVVFALAVLLPLCIPGVVVLTIQFAARYALERPNCST
jgi:hypothetical protein